LFSNFTTQLLSLLRRWVSSSSYDMTDILAFLVQKLFWLFFSNFGWNIIPLFLGIDIILKIDWLMACTACLVANVSCVSGCCRNIGSYSKHIFSPGSTALSAHQPCQPACIVLCLLCSCNSVFLPSNMPWTVHFFRYLRFGH